MRRPVAALVIVLLLALAGCTVPTRSAGLPDRPGNPPGMSETPAPDPTTDVLGWENGYWQDDPLAIDVADGLNETELGAIVNRSMARVEYLRRAEFDRVVPVEVISRAAFRERVTNDSGGANRAARLFDNVVYEALFLVGEGGNARASRENNTASSVQGFYALGKDRITIVSATESPAIAEETLAHELVHALQWGLHDMRGLGGWTIEASNAHEAVIEGVATYLDRRYAERCGAEWHCVTTPPTSDAGNGGDSDSGSSIHFGLYILRYFPYSDGPGFVEHVKSGGGWEAVSELYARPPASTEQVIDPEKYGEDAPTKVTIRDRSAGGWERLDLQGRPSFESFGQPGITAALAYPAYDERSQDVVVSPREFLNYEGERVDRSDPFDYDIKPADGWDGDRLRVYTDASNRTGYVWRLVWDTPSDAREFARSYRRLLRYWGGQRRSADVWRIPEGESRFADAFAIHVEGTTVTIVNAPTVGDLAEVHGPVTSWREAGG
ncbi:MAG: Hvo_1808 family surface protein [Halanaeroarchaeum sp.]